MNENLYDKKVKCPVCESEITITKVKTRGVKVHSRDTDFCINYEGLNPLFYDIWVCDYCGYASWKDSFDTISQMERADILKNISSHWTKRIFSGERDIDNAIEVFKLALLNMKIRKMQASQLAKICLRLAWLYRFKEDEKEGEYLELALNCYADAYENERFPVDKLDESTCIYMIAELNRRLERYEESIKWFSRLISSPEARANKKLVEIARDQYYIAKEELDKKNN